MPTGKALKATRKLKIHQKKTNANRISRGKKPLGFKYFYNTSKGGKKRRHSQIQPKYNDNGNNARAQPPPNKRPKLIGGREVKLGFGPEMDETSPEYQKYLADFQNDSSSSEEGDEGEGQSDTERDPEMADNPDTISTIVRPSKSDIVNENSMIENEIIQHQQELEKLKALDPEFYEQLRSLDGGAMLKFSINDSKHSHTSVSLSDNEISLTDVGNVPHAVHKIDRQRTQHIMEQLMKDDADHADHEHDHERDHDNDDDEEKEASAERQSASTDGKTETDTFMNESDGDSASDGGHDNTIHRKTAAMLEFDESDIIANAMFDADADPEADADEDNHNHTRRRNAINDDNIQLIADGDDDDDDDDDADETHDRNIEFGDGGSDYSNDPENDSDDDDNDDESKRLLKITPGYLQSLISDVSRSDDNTNTSTHNKQAIVSLRKIMNLFCSFVQMTIIDDDMNHQKNKNTNQKKRKQKLRLNKSSLALANSPVFRILLRYCLTKLGTVIPNVLKVTEKQKSSTANLNKNTNFLKFRTILKRYLRFLFSFLNSISDASMQRLFLIHCKQMCFLLLTMNQSMQRFYFKRIIHLWSSGSPNVRIDAFLFLYEIGKYMTDNDLLKLFKYMYQAYVTVCKRVSVNTMPGIHFMMNSMTQMYCLNPVLSYQDSFHRLRAIAFHVKQAIATMSKHPTKNQSTKTIHSQKLKKTKSETLQSIYNWRFINIIRLWAKVLGAHANRKNSDMHLLYYPFIQISISVLTLSRSAAYDPGRLKIMEAILELICVCQQSSIADRRIYVPLAPYFISILNNPAFSKKQKPGALASAAKETVAQADNESQSQNGAENETAVSTNIIFKIKIAEKDFGTSTLHMSLITHCARLVFLYFSYYSYSIAFPEIIFPFQVFLNEFLANGNIANYMKKNVKLLSIKMKENEHWILKKRQTVEFSPKDFEKVHMFLYTERMHGLSVLSKFIKTKSFQSLLSELETDNLKFGGKNKNKNRARNKRKVKQRNLSKVNHRNTNRTHAIDGDNDSTKKVKQSKIKTTNVTSITEPLIFSDSD